MYLSSRTLWTLFSLLAFCSYARFAHASTIHVQFNTIDPLVSYKMIVLKDKHVLWSSTGSEHWAIVCNDRDMILSGSGYRGTVRARTASGKKLWAIATDFSPELESYVGAEVSGNILMLWGRGPTFGVSGQYVETFPDILERRRLSAYDVRTGHFIWGTSPLKVGRPIWMNGKVFVSVAYDASDKAIRRNKKSGRPLPVFMEEWSLLPCRRLWRKRIPGDPSVLASVRKTSKHSIRLTFRARDTPTFEDNFLRFLNKFSIVIPLLHGGIPKEATKPTLYERDGIY